MQFHNHEETQVTLKLLSAVELTETANLPRDGVLIKKQFSDARHVKIGKMLAMVPIVSADVSCVTIHGLGDEDVLGALQANLVGDTIHLSAPLPLVRPASLGAKVAGLFGGFGKQVAAALGEEDVLVVDGQEVDQDRYIHLVVMVPTHGDIKIGDVYGPIGIQDHRGKVTLDSEPGLNLHAVSVGELTGVVSSQSNLAVDTIRGNADIKIAGPAEVGLGETSGDLRIAAQSHCQVDSGPVKGSVSLSSALNGAFDFLSVEGDIEIDDLAFGEYIFQTETSRSLTVSLKAGGSVYHEGTVTKLHQPRTGLGGFVRANGLSYGLAASLS